MKTAFRYTRDYIAAALDVPHGHVALVGSELITGEGNDRDYIALVPTFELVDSAGYTPDVAEVRDDYDGTDFRSYRDGHVNLLATTDANYFLSEISIALAAKYAHRGGWNFDRREDRVEFHRLVREGVRPHREEVAPFSTSDDDILALN